MSSEQTGLAGRAVPHSAAPPVVLQTDRAWPDDTLEREIVEAAGLRLISAPPDPAPPATIEALAAEHQPAAILTCWAQVTPAAIAAATPLRVIARTGVGLDNIAVQAATARGVLVTNVPDYCVEEVSDHAVGMALVWTRGLVAADREVQSGRWNPAAAKLRRLSTLTCGVVGFGRIGRRSAAKLSGLGARVLVSDPHPPADTGAARAVDLGQLLRESDIVVLHAPLTEQTRHLIGTRELGLMRPGALLVNVSRGGLVDTHALVGSLRAGHLGGAGLDVLEEEPDVAAELLARPEVVLTPHIAFSSDASVAELRRSAAEEVVRVLRGDTPLHPCNAPTLPSHGALS